jgi:hypothetical protein
MTVLIAKKAFEKTEITTPRKKDAWPQCVHNTRSLKCSSGIARGRKRLENSPEGLDYYSSLAILALALFP